MIEKKKLLLFGENRSLINDFFTQLTARFEMLSCSSREEDILGHLKYYDADALVFLSGFHVRVQEEQETGESGGGYRCFR